MDDHDAVPKRRKKKKAHNAEADELQDGVDAATSDKNEQSVPSSSSKERWKKTTSSVLPVQDALPRNEQNDVANHSSNTKRRRNTEQTAGPEERTTLDIRIDGPEEVGADVLNDNLPLTPSRRKPKAPKRPQAASSPKNEVVIGLTEIPQQRKRSGGRPKGSKNKPKAFKPPKEELPKKTPGRRGRPPGSLNKRPLMKQSDWLVPGGVSTLKPRKPRTIPKKAPTKNDTLMRAPSSRRKRLREELDEDEEWDPDVGESAFVVATKVLKAQVTFLVRKCGASKWFENAVKHLWTSYLTVALPDVNEGVEGTLMASNRWLNALRDSDFCVLLNCKNEFMLKTLHDWKLHRFLSGADIEVPENIPKERADRMKWVRKAPNGNQKHIKNIMTELTDAEIEFEETAQVHEPAYHKKINVAPERLTMTRIVALVALALYIAEERILVSDLLRWIRCMQFPYMDTKLKTREERSTWKLLYGLKEYVMMSYSDVEYHMQRLYVLLDLRPRDFPVVSVAPLARRFVEELNLPRELLVFVMALVDKINLMEYTLDLKGAAGSYMKQRASNVEALVMACIFHALRFAFGLDGKAEKAISAETRALRNLVDGSVKLFDFQEWKGQLDLRRSALSRYTNISPQSSLSSRLGMLNVKVMSWRKMEVSRQHPFDYVTLQKSFQNDKRCHKPYVTLEDYEKFIWLPPTLRPYRAHAEALTDTFPSLKTDYEQYSLSHVFVDEVLASKGHLPPSWNVVEEEKRYECLRSLGRLKAAQAVCYNDSYPLRAHNNRASTSLAHLDFVRSRTMQWLIRTMAGMIEQDPKPLLGEIMYLEMGLFPNNNYCKAYGMYRNDILKMRAG